MGQSSADGERGALAVEVNRILQAQTEGLVIRLLTEGELSAGSMLPKSPGQPDIECPAGIAEIGHGNARLG